MFDFTYPGFLGLMESEGMMDTNEGLISRVSKVLENSPSNVKSYSFCAEQNDD
jgi:hypothetical protein